MDLQNRNNFLNNVAEQLGRPRRSENVERPTWTKSPQWDVYRGYSEDELINILEKQCKAIHTNFKRTDLASLKAVLTETIHEHNGKKIIVAKDPRNEKYGLLKFFDELNDGQVELQVWDSDLGAENITFAEKADIGITFSEMTLAESGTVTLFNDKNNSCTISLLPRAHIVIIPKDTIVPRLTQAMKEIHEENKQGSNLPSCISFISGPSNSADIEMSLIVGVHGPVEVTYIVVE